MSDPVTPGSTLTLSGTVIDLGREPDDALGIDVDVVTLRQSSPGGGRTLKVPLIARDKSIVKSLKKGQRVVATCCLGAGDSSHAAVEVEAVEKVNQGEEMQLVNAGVVIGVRDSLEYKPFAKGGGVSDLMLVVDGKKVCLKLYGGVIDLAEDTAGGETLKVQFRINTRPDGDGVVTSAVASDIEPLP